MSPHRPKRCLLFGLLLIGTACSSHPTSISKTDDSDTNSISTNPEDTGSTADNTDSFDEVSDADTGSWGLSDTEFSTDSETSSDIVDAPDPCVLNLVEIGADATVVEKCELFALWYWYADEAGTTVDASPETSPFVPGRGMCLKGRTIVDPTYAAWGAGIGLSTGNPDIDSSWNAAKQQVVGMEVRITGSTGNSDLRMLVESSSFREDGASPPFAALSGPGRYRVLFDNVRVPETWTPNGDERVNPETVWYISFHVAGGDVPDDFDFCVAELSPIVVDVIDDLEDGDDHIAKKAGRSGGWYTYNDGTGNQSPTPVAAADAGVSGEWAAVTSGDGFETWGAGMGFNLSYADMPHAYDASEYAGLFVRLRGRSPTGSIRVSPFTRAVSDPRYGGTCDLACDAPHFWEIKVSDTWSEAVLPFYTLFELGLSGVPFDAADLLGVNFQAQEGGEFEIAIDEIAFYRSAVSSPAPDPGASIELGFRRDLLGPHAFGLSAFPDQAVLALERDDATRYFITAWPEDGTAYPSAGKKMPTFALDAPGLDELAAGTATEVLTPGDAGEFDNGYAGLSGLYRHSDGRLYGFYHAEDWEDTGLIPDTGDVQVAAFYAMVGAAVSDDDGLTWAKLGPVIRSNTPKEWLAYPEHTDRGVCGPSSLTDVTNRYLYLYYTDNSRQNDRGVQISLARADLSKGPPLPGQFQKYYLGDFTEPGLGGLESPLPGEDRMIYYPNLGYGHVVYSDYLQRYVMVQNVDYWLEHSGDSPLPLSNSGIGISFSEDGIYWSAPRILVTDYVAFRSGRSFSYMGQILFDDQTGKTGTLVYGHSDNWGIGPGESMHHLVGHTVSF